MAIEGFGASDKGKARPGNEDASLVDNDRGLYIVADGMGGHAKGEIASRLAVAAAIAVVDHHRHTIESIREGNEVPGRGVDIAKEAVLRACQDVYNMATQKPGHAGMGSTMTLLVPLGPRAVMAHVGDSRLYLVRNGAVSQLSSDHTMVAELVKMGVVKPEDAHGHPHSHILTRAIGSQPSVQVETLLFDLMPDDQLVLCSDGLSNYFGSPNQLLESLTDEPAASARALVDFANEAGGGDNITAVVVAVGSDEDAAQALATDPSIPNRLFAIESVELFSGLSLAHLQRVLNLCEQRPMGQDEVILAAGEPGSAMYIVLEGQAGLYADGTLLRQLSPGDAAGEALLVCDRPARSTLKAIESGHLLVLEQRHFQELIDRRPRLGIVLLQRLACSLAQRNERLLRSRAPQAALSSLPKTELL